MTDPPAVSVTQCNFKLMDWIARADSIANQLCDFRGKAVFLHGHLACRHCCIQAVTDTGVIFAAFCSQSPRLKWYRNNDTVLVLVLFVCAEVLIV